ncbi:MAG: hypothetical protein HRT68_08165, partial [Flavobacteriaceae bacterium]|nr:hypothetical protein [Flavobacteriaceae bacterium]
LDKASVYDEKQIIKKGIVSKQQLSNLKANLYKQLLKSLRLNPSHQNIRVYLREQLDYATILYNKGLYKQGLKTLEKAKQLAIENEEKNIAYEIVELEKVIETQYITRSIESRANELTIQAKELSQLNILTSKLSNLSLQLYGLLLKTGYVKSEEEHRVIQEYFESRMPVFDHTNLGFRERLWLNKSNLWYSFLTQDFLATYKYANKWVRLFDEYPKMISLNPVFYLKGNHYLLESLFLIKHHTKFKQVLDRLEHEITSEIIPQNSNTEALSFLYLYTNKLNLHFLEGDFSGGLYLVDEIETKLPNHIKQLDGHHVMIFYYKIACLFFCTGNNKKCIEYLSRIINNKTLKMREDLLCFSRVLSLVAHYEEGIDYNFENQLKSTYKYLLKMNDLQKVQKEMIRFLRNLGNVYPHQIKGEFKQLHTQLKQYEDHPYEKRAFLYLDILSWLESKIENKPVDVIIQEKFSVLSR